eukprot:TRINITY_DN17800_c0_g1_i2.p1 TRINITY_DN17800_c0_g1~~TRINITY_DN17800_c0_g1_i2.p1  ORF type:complete len:681 (+),score=70.45 TRINITY_DN17800_c0_g1_i2:919-2961(+)
MEAQPPQEQAPPRVQLYDHPDYCMLWPRPKQVHELNAHPITLSTASGLAVWVNPLCCNKRGMRSWGVLRDALTEQGCFPVLCTTPSAIEASISLRICPDLFSKSDAYKLHLVGGRISLTGSDDTGLFYAVLTFVQLLRFYAATSSEGVTLPPLKIHDWPDLSRRGVMLDLRTRCLGLADLCSTAEMLCTLKVNELHLYLEQTLHFNMHPQIRALPGLSSSDCIELYQHCQDLGIHLVWHQSCHVLPGWLQNSEYLHLAEPGEDVHETLSLSNPKSLEFVSSLLDQVLNLPSQSSMVGVGMELAGAVADHDSSQATHEAYVKFVHSVHAMVRARNKVMMIWGDNELLLPKQQQDSSLMPQDAIVLVRALGSDPHAAYERCCSRLAECDVPFYVSMPTPGWTGAGLGLESTIDRIGAATTKGMKYGAIGGVVAHFSADGSEALIDDMATSLLGVLIGVGCMWNGSTAQLLDQSLLASLVATHLLGSHSHEDIARGIVTLAACHLDTPSVGPHVGLSPSPSALMQLLIFDGVFPPIEGLEVLTLKRAVLVITGCIDTLSAAPEKLKGSLEISQVLMAAELQLFACQLGLALLAAHEKVHPVKVTDIPHLITTDLLGSFQKLMAKSRALWNQGRQLAGSHEADPNCTAGLKHLEHLLASTMGSGGINSCCITCLLYTSPSPRDS